MFDPRFELGLGSRNSTVNGERRGERERLRREVVGETELRVAEERERGGGGEAEWAEKEAAEE